MHTLTIAGDKGEAKQRGVLYVADPENPRKTTEVVFWVSKEALGMVKIALAPIVGGHVLLVDFGYKASSYSS